MIGQRMVEPPLEDQFVVDVQSIRPPIYLIEFWKTVRVPTIPLLCLLWALDHHNWWTKKPCPLFLEAHHQKTPKEFSSVSHTICLYPPSLEMIYKNHTRDMWKHKIETVLVLPHKNDKKGTQSSRIPICKLIPIRHRARLRLSSLHSAKIHHIFVQWFRWKNWNRLECAV